MRSESFPEPPEPEAKLGCQGRTRLLQEAAEFSRAGPGGGRQEVQAEGGIWVLCMSG